MTQYVDKSLAADEKILVRGKWPTAYWVGAWALLIILGVLVIGVFLFIRAVIRMKTTEFAVTDKRVILKSGWLTRTTHELSVESIEGVNLEQSVWGRLFRYGSVVVSGTGEARIVFPPMGNPIDFRRAIEDARSVAREVHLSPATEEAVAAAVSPTVSPAAAPAEPSPPEASHTFAPQRGRKRFVGLFGG